MDFNIDYVDTDITDYIIDFTHKMELSELIPKDLKDCCQQIKGVDYLGY